MGRRRTQRLTVAAVAIVALAIAAAGCGSSQGTTGTTVAVNGDHSGHPTAYVAHPHVVQPVAGAAAASVSSASAGGVSAGGATAGVSVSSSAQPKSLPQPQSLAQIRQELAASGMTASPNQATLTSDLLAITPVDAPAAVQEVIAAGNRIARLPYIWGGGHATYEDTGYDCSGSLSYVLSAAHLLNTTLTSTQFENWGEPGPGKWITVYATDGHTFMYVAGLRFDTVALAETGSRWSDRAADEPDLGSFVERHPAGL